MHEFVLFLLAESTTFMAINAGQQKNCTSPTGGNKQGFVVASDDKSGGSAVCTVHRQRW